MPSADRCSGHRGWASACGERERFVTLGLALLARWLAVEDDRRLLVVGGASLDVLHVRGVPTPSAGGAGLYTALAAARAGAEVTMLAPRPDPMPPELAPALEMIEWVGPVVPPDRLPRFEIGYHPDGELRLFVEAAGAEPELSSDLLDDMADIAPLAYVVPFLDADLQQRFVRALTDRGCLTVASTYAKAAVEEQPTVLATAEAADLGFCNRAEAEVLFGGVERAGAGPGRLRFVTLGAEGAFVFQGGYRTAVPAPVVEVVDPTGAGDTFCGTTLARLVAGDHPVVAARTGARAAAEEVTGVGPAILFGPLAEGPRDPRVRVDPDRVGALAELVAGLDELDPYPFIGDGLPEVGDPGALDFFFAATLQQFGFWTERDGRYHRPVIAEQSLRLLELEPEEGGEHVQPSMAVVLFSAFELRQVDLARRRDQSEHPRRELLHFPLERVDLGVALASDRSLVEARPEEGLLLGQLAESDPRDALDEDLDAAGHDRREPADDGARSVVEQAGAVRLLHRGVALGDDEDLLLLGRDRRLDRGDGDGASRGERHPDVREQDRVLEGEDGQLSPVGARFRIAHRCQLPVSIVTTRRPFEYSVVMPAPSASHGRRSVRWNRE